MNKKLRKQIKRSVEQAVERPSALAPVAAPYLFKRPYHVHGTQALLPFAMPGRGFWMMSFCEEKVARSGSFPGQLVRDAQPLPGPPKDLVCVPTTKADNELFVLKLAGEQEQQDPPSSRDRAR